MKVGALPLPLAEHVREAIADKVPCPFMAAMTKSGQLPMDQDGVVKFDDLRAALKSVGVGFGARELLTRGTKGVEEERLTKAGKLLKGMEVEGFDITQLQHTTLMHTGDLKIRRGGFKQEKLDWLLSFSSDGKTLTFKDLARAQKAAVQADPGTRGQVIGMAEVSALFRLFGTRNADGDKSLSKDALTRMFRDAEFPTDWKGKGSLGLPSVFGNMARMAFHQVFTPSGRAAAGLDKALGNPSPMEGKAATALGKAICPVGGRAAIQPSTASEAYALHQPDAAANGNHTS